MTDVEVINVAVYSSRTPDQHALNEKALSTASLFAGAHF
jgi:hypothetical protein